MGEYPASGGVMRPGGLGLTDRLVALSGLDGGRLADIGCGHGSAALHLAARGFAVVGVDKAALWQGGHRRCRFVVADAACMPFADGAFDGVLLECALSVLPGAALGECRRVLAPGGRLLVSDLYDPHGCGRLSRDWWRGLLEGNGFRAVALEDRTGDLRDYVAHVLWETGSLEALRGCLGGDGPRKPGYFLLVAEKLGL